MGVVTAYRYFLTGDTWGDGPTGTSLDARAWQAVRLGLKPGTASRQLLTSEFLPALFLVLGVRKRCFRLCGNSYPPEKMSPDEATTTDSTDDS